MKIGGIIVLYRPNWEITAKAISSLAPQVDALCIVDNTPDTDETVRIGKLANNIAYIPLKENIGIAAAQNAGIKHLADHGEADLVVFSDQDTLAPDGLVKMLADTFLALQERNMDVGAVGTRAINRVTGKAYAAKSKEIRKYEGKELGTQSDITECYSVISSISMISMISLTDTVGGFDEALFIDGVDHEWCWRAWHKARLRSFIVEDAKISHMLGEKSRKIGQKDISISATTRLFYQYRNYLWLCRRSYTPRFWKKKHLLKYAVKLFYYPIMVKPRWKNLQNIICGIAAGLRPQHSHL